jgi:hypothetical protein
VMTLEEAINYPFPAGADADEAKAIEGVLK